MAILDTRVGARCTFCKEEINYGKEFFSTHAFYHDKIDPDFLILNDTHCHWHCFYEWEKSHSFIDFYYSLFTTEDRPGKWPDKVLITKNYCISASKEHIKLRFKDPPVSYYYKHDTIFKDIAYAARRHYKHFPVEKAKMHRTFFEEIMGRKDEIEQKIKDVLERIAEYEEQHKHDFLKLNADSIDYFQSDIKEYILLGKNVVSYAGQMEKSRISKVEQKLGVTLPDSYKWFLQTYGQLTVYGKTFLGITADAMPCVEETLILRKEGLPGYYVIVFKKDNNIICLNTGESHFNECYYAILDEKYNLIEQRGHFYNLLKNELENLLEHEILLDYITVIPEWIEDSYGNISKGCDEEKITEIEKILEVQLPESYKKVLRMYGEFEVEDIIIFGVKDNKELTCVEKTLEQRNIGLPDKSVVISRDYKKVIFYDTSQMVEGECPIMAWKRDGTIERDSKDIIAFVADQRIRGSYDYFEYMKFFYYYDSDEILNRNLALFRAEEPENSERQKEYSEYSSELYEEFYTFKLQKEIERDMQIRVQRYLDDFKSEIPEDQDRQKDYSEYSNLLQKRFDEFAERKIQEEQRLEEVRKEMAEKEEKELIEDHKRRLAEKSEEMGTMEELLGMLDPDEE